MRSIWLVLAVALLVPTAAEAGKKNKKKKKGEEPVAEQVEEAPPAAPEAPAAAPTERVEMPCTYVPGSTHRYSFEKYTSKERGESSQVRRYTSEIAVDVVAHELPQTVVDLRTGTVEILQSDDPGFDAMVERLSQADAPVPRVAVDHEQVTMKLQNLDAMVALYEEAADLAVELLQEQKGPLPEQVVAGMRAMITRPEMVEMSSTGDWHPLFTFSCGAVPVGTVQYEAALPNPFGGEPLPATGTMTTTVGDTVQVVIEETVDPSAAKAMIVPVLAQMGTPIPEEALDQVLAQAGGLDLTTRLDVTLDPATGWPTGWKAEKKSQMGPMGGSLETTTVSRLPDEQGAPTEE